ncbi:MAG: hypothetical protein LLG14_10110 [Nocardiaceae bacterium]|nr:hypothetical protein [Nocardiaceae bacterium]
MPRSGVKRAALSVLACSTVVLALPGQAEAAPGGIDLSAVPANLGSVLSPDAIASLAPAVIGLLTTPAAGTDAQASLLEQAKASAAALPPQIGSVLTSVVKFIDGSGGGGPKIPTSDGVVISQFLYPSVGPKCISETGHSVGTALAVPGPAKLPVPGPKKGQTAFVFTALGTPLPTAHQSSPMEVTWVNISTGKTGTTKLTDDAKINHPNGPATLSGTANTGSGRVLAIISGSLTTQAAGQKSHSCSFLPTIGTVEVP